MPKMQVDESLLSTWAFYCGVLTIKLLAMSTYTGLTRMRLKAFANPEDGATLKVKPRVDDKVERIRRAHLNDIENIIPFTIISGLYILTNPSHGMATMLFRIVTISRFLHTFVYAVVPLPQPSRAIAYFIPYAITFYMGFKAVIHFM